MHQSKYLLTLASLLLLSFYSIAQELSEKEMIGFGCWASGGQTKVVAQGLQLISKCHLKGLRKNLNNNNSAKQFFAVTALTNLERAGSIQLTERELGRISEIRSSQNNVAFCDGCTVFGETTLQKALTESHTYFQAADFWIKRKIKEVDHCR